MKLYVLFGLAMMAAQGLSFGLCSAECEEVHFQLYDLEHDPACGIDLGAVAAIRVTTSPSSISAGTCSSFALDNYYANVEFFAVACGSMSLGTCAIVATDGSLSGYYPVTAISGLCLTVCANCTS